MKGKRSLPGKSSQEEDPLFRLEQNDKEQDECHLGS